MSKAPFLVNASTIASLILIITGMIFAAVVYIIRGPESISFITGMEQMLIAPIGTALILGGPLGQIMHNTNSEFDRKLENQTNDIVNNVSNALTKAVNK